MYMLVIGIMRVLESVCVCVSAHVCACVYASLKGVCVYVYKCFFLYVTTTHLNFFVNVGKNFVNMCMEVCVCVCVSDLLLVISGSASNFLLHHGIII